MQCIMWGYKEKGQTGTVLRDSQAARMETYRYICIVVYMCNEYFTFSFCHYTDHGYTLHNIYVFHDNMQDGNTYFYTVCCIQIVPKTIKVKFRAA